MVDFVVNVYPKRPLENHRFGRAFIGVSVGPNGIQNLVSLGHAIDWSRGHIGGFDFLIGDYLNRHNFEAFDHLTESAAVHRSMELGKRSLAQIENLLEARSIADSHVLSARDLYSDPSFEIRLTSFREAYKRSSQMRNRIDEAVVRFLKRMRKDAASEGLVYEHCVAYQLEELALFELLAGRGYTDLIYAGPQLPVMKALASKSITGISALLEGFGLIELRNARLK